MSIYISIDIHTRVYTSIYTYICVFIKDQDRRLIDLRYHGVMVTSVDRGSRIEDLFQKVVFLSPEKPLYQLKSRPHLHVLLGPY